MSFILLQGPPGSSRASPGVQTWVPAGEQSQPCYSPAPWEQSKGQTWAPWPQSKEPSLNPLSSQDEGEATMRLLPPPQHPLPQQQQPWAQLYHIRTCINPPLAPGWGIYSLQDGFRVAGRESSSAMAGCTPFVGSRGGAPCLQGEAGATQGFPAVGSSLARAGPAPRMPRCWRPGAAWQNELKRHGFEPFHKM